MHLLQELCLCVFLRIERFLLSCSMSSSDQRGKLGASTRKTVLPYICYRKDEGFFFSHFRKPWRKGGTICVQNVTVGHGRGLCSDQRFLGFFLVKNSLSFINKLPYFFTKITVYIPTLSLPLEKMFLLALLLVHIVVISVRMQNDYQ